MAKRGRGRVNNLPLQRAEGSQKYVHLAPRIASKVKRGEARRVIGA
jgi:hypothetical protein